MQKSDQIRDKIRSLKQFKVVQCRMVHEKVQVDADGRPHHNCIDDNIIFERIALCPAEERNHRLGCAHTKANVSFNTLLSDLKELIPSKRDLISKMQSKFNELVTRIYMLDHKRGFLEHDRALLNLSPEKDLNKDDILKNISDLELQHDKLMTELKNLKNKIIKNLSEY